MIKNSFGSFIILIFRFFINIFFVHISSLFYYIIIGKIDKFLTYIFSYCHVVEKFEGERTEKFQQH